MRKNEKIMTYFALANEGSEGIDSSSYSGEIVIKGEEPFR